MDKRMVASIAGMIIILSIIVLSLHNEYKTAPIDNYSVLVIETTQGQSKTYFNYYDENFKLIYQKSIPYSEFVSTSVDRLCEDSGKLYFAPVDGDWEGKNDMLIINLKTGTLEGRTHLPDELDLDKYITVKDGEKYINSNVNGDSYICRIDSNNVIKEYKKVENETLGEMIVADDRLYSFNYSEEGEKGHITVFQKTNLDIIKNIEMDCSDGLHPLIVNDTLYFLTGENEDENSLLVGKYSISEDKLSFKQVDESDTAYYLLTQPIKVNDKMWFAASCEDGSCSLYKYDFDSGNVEKNDMGQVSIRQIATKANSMFALIDDNTDVMENCYVMEYDITNSVPILKAQHGVATQVKGKELYYAAGFIIR